MIHTKVARILSSTQIVLAAGVEDGVQEGMEFLIYDLSDPILDPETKEELGQLEIVKGRVKVGHVQEKMCTATTFSRRVTRAVDPFRALASHLVMPLVMPREVTETVYDEMRVEGAQSISNDLIVRVGDRARST